MEENCEKQEKLSIKSTLEDAQPINKQKRVRPCYHGHLTTSAKDARRRLVWHSVPRNAVTWGIPVGSALCQKCYDAHKKAAETGEQQKIDTMSNT